VCLLLEVIKTTHIVAQAIEVSAAAALGMRREHMVNYLQKDLV